MDVAADVAAAVASAERIMLTPAAEGSGQSEGRGAARPAIVDLPP